MAAKRSNDTDWYSVFLEAFTPDGAVQDSSDSPAAQAAAPTRPPRNEFERRFGVQQQVDDDDDDGGPYFTRAPPAPKPKAAAAVGLGPDVDVPSASKGGFDFSPMDENEQGEHVSLEQCSKSSPKVSGQKKNDCQADDVDLGLGLPSASKAVCDFSPMDEDEQGAHVSLQQCSKSSPKFNGQKKNCGQLPLNKKKSQGHGGKRKPSVNKRRPAHATEKEESDYERSLPSRFSRRKQGLQNSSSVRSQKVEDVVLLDDEEDMEPKEEVNREMSDRLNKAKIYYPSRDDQEAVDLTKSDVKCLDPKAFLSSPVINFYIKYIQRTRLCNENFRDKFYIFNTYFFGKLEEALYQTRDFAKLRRWWKGVNIFNNAYIMLPIHAKNHWSLVIICLPPKDRISEPIILHLDSLGMHRSAMILNTVERYLEMEWRLLSVAEPEWPCLQTDIRKETVKVPQQDNSYDCGVFMLYYIEQFIKEAPARFTTDKLAMFSRSWFEPKEASGLRQRIRELLLEEFESAARMADAIPKADASKVFDSIKKDREIEADDSSEMMVVESEEALEMSRDASKSVKGISVGDTGKANKGFKVTESGYPDKCMEHIADVAMLDKEPNTSSNKCNEKNNADARMDDAISKADACEIYDSKKDGDLEADDSSKMVIEVGVGLGNTIESNGGMKVAESEEAIEVYIDAAQSVKGISVAELDEASGEFTDTGNAKKGIKVTKSGYPDKCIEHIANITVLNRGPTTSSNKCNEKKNNAGYVVSEAAPCSDSVVKDKKGTVKIDSGSSKAEKEGKSIGIALPERLKGTEEVMGVDIGVERSEGNEEATSSMPVPDTVWETSGAKLWITRIHRPTSGTTLKPDNWSWSSGGSSRDARKEFIEHFCRKS